jgi:hypothetical protein
VLAALGVWAGYATKTSGRDLLLINSHDILVLRILKSPEGVDYFARRGVPDLEAMKEEVATATTATSEHSPVIHDVEYNHWVRAHWKAAYAGWLLRHPVATIRGPAGEMPELLSGFADYASVNPALPGPIQDTLWDRNMGAGEVALFVALAFVLWLASLRAPRRNNLDAFAAGVLALTIVWYYIAWTNGVVELPRIMTPMGAGLRIGLLILALAAVDRLLTGRRLDSSTPPGR